MINLNTIERLKIYQTILFLGLFVTACSSEEDTSTPDPVDPPVVVIPPTFKGPIYADNYSPIASWSSKSQWNLANVHDPSVEKSGDYYYCEDEGYDFCSRKCESEFR